jgi:hypothetical protein
MEEKKPPAARPADSVVGSDNRPILTEVDLPEIIAASSWIRRDILLYQREAESADIARVRARAGFNFIRRANGIIRKHVRHGR